MKGIPIISIAIDEPSRGGDYPKTEIQMVAIPVERLTVEAFDWQGGDPLYDHE
jgi:hypothetical protein